MNTNEIADLTAERDSLLRSVIAGAFSGSRYIAEKLRIPPDMAQARFGSSFKVENGVVVAKNGSGDTIYSRSNPGNPASFDEAMEALVDAYEHRDGIRRAAPKTEGTVVTRRAFDAMSPHRKMEYVKSGGKLVD